MPIFSKSNLKFNCNPKIADEVRPIIERLIRDDADGETYRRSVSFWPWFERPILRSYKGDRYFLQIEGPAQKIDSFTFPMGSEIMAPDGWLRLDPMETEALVTEIGCQIDIVIRDWCERNSKAASRRKHPDRPIDDVTIIGKITDWIAQIPTEEEASDVH